MPPATRPAASTSFALSATAYFSVASVIVRSLWQGQRESNPQPSVLETDALPVELCPYPLLEDLGDDAGADGLAALADGEAHALLHGDRRDKRPAPLAVVPGHHHLG